MNDRTDEIRELLMPVIWDTWCVNEISWSEILEYLNKQFTNDVLDSLGMIAEETVSKHTLLTKEQVKD